MTRIMHDNPTVSNGRKVPLRSVNGNKPFNRCKSWQAEKPKSNPRSNYKLPLSGNNATKIQTSSKDTSSQCAAKQLSCFISDADGWRGWICAPVGQATNATFRQQTSDKIIHCLLCGLNLKTTSSWEVHCRGEHHRKTFSLLRRMKKMHEKQVERFSLVLGKIKLSERGFGSTSTAQQKRAFYNDFLSSIGNSKDHVISPVFVRVAVSRSLVLPEEQAQVPIHSSQHSCKDSNEPAAEETKENFPETQHPNTIPDVKLIKAFPDLESWPGQNGRKIGASESEDAIHLGKQAQTGSEKTIQAMYHGMSNEGNTGSINETGYNKGEAPFSTPNHAGDDVHISASGKAWDKHENLTMTEEKKKSQSHDGGTKGKADYVGIANVTATVTARDHHEDREKENFAITEEKKISQSCGKDGKTGHVTLLGSTKADATMTEKQIQNAEEVERAISCIEALSFLTIF